MSLVVAEAGLQVVAGVVVFVSGLTDALGRVEVPIRITAELPGEELTVLTGQTLLEFPPVSGLAGRAIPIVLHLHSTAQLPHGLGLSGTAAGHPVHGRHVSLQTKDRLAVLLAEGGVHLIRLGKVWVSEVQFRRFLESKN